MKIITIGMALCTLVLALSSCTTYLMSVTDFTKLYEGKQRTRQVSTQSPWGGISTYYTYPIDYIPCHTSNGRKVELICAPSIEMRITDTNGRRTVFYFDRVVLRDSIVGGSTSRILGFSKTIHLGAIKKIELQDGGKNYHYVKMRR